MKVATDRLSEALELLRTYCPRRYGRALRSLRGFLVIGRGPERASYDSDWRVCAIKEAFMLGADATPAGIATTVVHEATHGWLSSRGISYAEPSRHRVEMICIRAALLVAERLPEAEAEIDRCKRQLTIEPEYFSDASFQARGVERLREMGLPDWLVRTLVRIRRRAAR